MDAPIWDVTVFTKNRERLLEGDVAAKLLGVVVAQARSRDLLSDEYFSVDSTRIEAWASAKSCKPKDGNGEARSNQTHASKTDLQARLYRKSDGQPSRLAYMGHVLMENRNGLVVGATLTQATGTAEREAALALIDALKPKQRVALGADKAYDVREFVRQLRARGVTPHVAINDHLTTTGKRRTSAIDGRTTRYPGYAVSLRVRKRIKEVFGWIFTLTAAAYNLIRLFKLAAVA